MKRKTMARMLVFCASAVVAAILGCLSAAGQRPHEHKTQNVILVMIDGLRWQEVFHGADPALLQTLGPKWLGDPEKMTAAAEHRYGGSTPDERRRELMPFIWKIVAAQGQLFGNRDLGSDSQVTNGFNVSYPGYNETLTGFPDTRINSNHVGPNPNHTVFEWLNAKPEFAGSVAAFGAWAKFNAIFNQQRCGFPVNAGYDPFNALPLTPKIVLLNQLKAEGVHVWDDEPFDPIPFHTALEYVKIAHPRVLFLGLGETDDWAHLGSYAAYLDAAHRDDEYLRALWKLVQSMPQYQGKTTLIVLPDHGRGDGARWTDHGASLPASRETWMAFLGPDTRALGERKGGPAVTGSQVAATLAALLGEDYHAAVAQSGPPIGDVLGK